MSSLEKLFDTYEALCSDKEEIGLLHNGANVVKGESGC